MVYFRHSKRKDDKRNDFCNYYFNVGGNRFAAMGFGIGYSGKESIISGIVGAVIAIAIIVLFIGAGLSQKKTEIEYYNNGICTICGGEYEFAGGSRYRNCSEYYYTCEDCGHTIQTSGIMK